MLDYGKYCGDLSTVDCEQGSFFEGTSDVHGKRLVGASQDGALRDQDVLEHSRGPPEILIGLKTQRT